MSRICCTLRRCREISSSSARPLRITSSEVEGSFDSAPAARASGARPRVSGTGWRRRECSRRLFSLAVLLLLAGACERRTPEPDRGPIEPAGDAVVAAVAPEPVRIPEGCAINLSGRYRAQADASFRYLIDDDGESLRATLQATDAGSGPAPRLELARTPEGFVGKVVAEALTAGGQRCPVHYEAQITACRAGEVVVRSQHAVSIDESCRVLDFERAAASDTVLLRE